MTAIQCQGEPDNGSPLLNVEPSANWRPGQRRFRERKSVEHTLRHGIRSMLRSVVRRDDFDLPDLAELDAVRVELDWLMAEAVANLRNQGHSWQGIADELRITRQSAWERYNRAEKQLGD